MKNIGFTHISAAALFGMRATGTDTPPPNRSTNVFAFPSYAGVILVLAVHCRYKGMYSINEPYSSSRECSAKPLSNSAQDVMQDRGSLLWSLAPQSLQTHLLAAIEISSTVRVLCVLITGVGLRSNGL